MRRVVSASRCERSCVSRGTPASAGSVALVHRVRPSSNGYGLLIARLRRPPLLYSRLGGGCCAAAEQGTSRQVRFAK
jgi:hypothetical protein